MERDIATTEVIEWLKQTAEKGTEFVETQAPLLANEIVAWHFWASVTLAIIFLAVTVAALFAVRWAMNVFSTVKEDQPVFGLAIAATMFSAAGIIIGPLGACMASYDAVKAAVAPRVVIMQYINGAVGR